MRRQNLVGRVAFAQRVGRVHQQVHEDLAEPEGVRAREDVGLEPAGDARPVSELHGRDLHRGLEHPVDVHRSDALFVAAAEITQRPDNLAHPLRALARVLEGGAHFLEGRRRRHGREPRQPLGEKLEV